MPGCSGFRGGLLPPVRALWRNLWSTLCYADKMNIGRPSFDRSFWISETFD